MGKIFISELTIINVRHLKNITIPLSNEKAKHLIFTGKNGSGKTSVLEAVSDYLNFWITSDKVAEQVSSLRSLQDPEVEHLLPYKNRKYPERKFDWNNLFWSYG